MSDALAEETFRSLRPGHSVRAILWRSVDALRRALGLGDERSAAAFIPRRDGPVLGDLHFAAGAWDLETVGHEVQHAVQHRIERVGPDRRELAAQLRGAEEEVATEAGRWVAHVARWLHQVDR
ncbi:MAG TPA: hypothetical protein PKA64_01520 [Myxococcota bacterium]|nr:hypothetical protein [Myxococcota bacterium]